MYCTTMSILVWQVTLRMGIIKIQFEDQLEISEIKN